MLELYNEGTGKAVGYAHYTQGCANYILSPPFCSSASCFSVRMRVVMCAQRCSMDHSS